MAGNPVPDEQDDLLSLCEDLADGCNLHETTIGILQNKEAVIRAAITALRNAESEFGTAKDARQDAFEALQTADAVAEDFLGAARGVLVRFLGNRYSTAWEPTGWPDQSTAVPHSQEKRMNLCASLKIYFTNVPAHENAPLGVTAALADAKFQAVSNARQGVGTAENNQTTKKQARDTALKGLRKRARGLIEELGTLLADDDGRWHAFGLSMPSDPDTPEIVAAVTLTAGTAGKVIVTWPRAPRATRYRVFGKVLTVDPDFVQRAMVHDREVTLEGLPGGQTLQIYVIAANDAGEAQPSGTESIVIP
ncbi:MAG: fibronectin type III domain-containing protein [Verrucomicrobia bacterium]|nr:fibronectin type III domain-containing protein [Verrucomicrobiota bacterium]